MHLLLVGESPPHPALHTGTRQRPVSPLCAQPGQQKESPVEERHTLGPPMGGGSRDGVGPRPAASPRSVMSGPYISQVVKYATKSYFFTFFLTWSPRWYLA